jgi:hypothetical protein
MLHIISPWPSPGAEYGNGDHHAVFRRILCLRATREQWRYNRRHMGPNHSRHRDKCIHNECILGASTRTSYRKLVSVDKCTSGQSSDSFLGSITVSHLGWRWVFWVMMIFAGFCALFGRCFLPETFEPVLLAKKVRYLSFPRNKTKVSSGEAFARPPPREEWGFICREREN